MSENVLKQIPKELWWKIFLMLFRDLNKIKDEKNEINSEINLPPYTPYEFPCPELNSIRETKTNNIKMERNSLLNTISNTCSYWEDITIKNKTFTQLFFEEHTQEFDGVELVSNKNKFLNVDHKMKIDELNMKIKEITSFRDNDEDCIIKQHKYEIIKSDLNPKLNINGDAIIIDNNDNNFIKQIQNIYANEADGIDIESVEERYREQTNIYEKMLKEDEECKERHATVTQTDSEYKEQETIQKKTQLIPESEFDDKIEILIKEREETLFNGFIDSNITYCDMTRQSKYF